MTGLADSNPSSRQLELPLIIDRCAGAGQAARWIERWRHVDGVRLLVTQDGSELIAVSASLELERDERTCFYRIPNAADQAPAKARAKRMKGPVN